MVIKKFVAPSMPEALAKVKSELGDQAVILKTRMNRKAGGPGNLKGVEVTAAVEVEKKSRFEPSPDIESENANSIANEMESMQSESITVERLNSLSEQLAELKNTMAEKKEEKPESKRALTFFGNLSGNMLEAGRELVNRNISEELALSIVSRLAQTENPLSLEMPEIKAQIRQTLCSIIPMGEPIKINKDGKTVVMFVGPTGSGKTSAIARLAMNYKIESNDRIAIITSDNFRADSSQQVKSYCRIIGCPFGVVYSPEELSMAIKSQEQGLILIDTPGVSPNNDEEISELLSLIRASKPHEIHLVIPASTPAKDVANMLDSFNEFGINKILVSKLDETKACGGVVTAVVNSGKKLSYLCRSREIPGQFGPALPESLAGALVVDDSSDNSEPKYEMEAVGIWQ
ncbi:MAG: flagellar biosynthesis protein FlhF [candidate division Zixibacteria bacterium]|nr:flagellar biosynthesis protein FlhF [candidate division Zixibacteria bacterium]